MSIVFPNSNLPTASQPWAREVTKQLSNIIASSTSSQINNAARDNQLNSSIIALNAVVNDVSLVAQQAADAAPAAQEAADDAAAAAATANSAASTANTALNGLLGLSSSSSGYTINVSNITSGTARDNTLTITTANARIELFNGGVDIVGPSAELKVGNAGNGGTLHNGSFTVLGGNIRAPGITSTTFLQAENHAGGGTTGASINNNGTIIRTSSSERYKQDIEELSVNYDDLLSLSAKRFRLKDEAAESPDARYYAGFIAEEIDQTSLKDFVAYQTLEDGTKRPDGVYYGELTAALLEAIKYQDSLIKSLTDRIENLEKGA